MSLSHLPTVLSRAFDALSSWLDRRTAARLPLLLVGILLASGRRTVTSWFRAAGITDEFRPAYHVVHAVGRRSRALAVSTWFSVQPCLAGSRRLRVAVDDTPTARYGPCVEGAGKHHNPTPGPAGEKFLYGHVWVTLAALAEHPTRGTIALPLLGSLYVRAKDVPDLPPERHWQFRTKLELAAEQLRWLSGWGAGRFDSRVAKRPFLRAAREHRFEVISRLRKDAALWSVPSGVRRPGQRGPLPTYGKERIDLAKRAGQTRGWQTVECVQYRERVVKTYKTFLATWRPAGGLIRVVLVQEEDGWIPLFSTNPDATVVEILEGAADRGSEEETFKDEKEVWGAGQQQLRNIDANVGAFNLNCWMYSLTEAWAWDRPDEELVDRSRCPWDDATRRPSHADKRKALQRQVLRREIDAALGGQPEPERIRELAERLLALAV
jgi:DDE superfamily endonuclease